MSEIEPGELEWRYGEYVVRCGGCGDEVNSGVAQAKVDFLVRLLQILKWSRAVTDFDRKWYWYCPACLAFVDSIQSAKR